MERKTFGKYDLIEMGDYNWHPLLWRILEEDSEKMLLLCETGMDFSCFNDSSDDNSWENSCIRESLNDEDEIEDRFEEDADKILVDPETGDKIFLLSAKQLVKYFPENFSRLCKTDDDIFEEFSESCPDKCFGKYIPWWLREAMELGQFGKKIMAVDGEGTVSNPLCAYENAFIRPAMWVKK